MARPRVDAFERICKQVEWDKYGCLMWTGSYRISHMSLYGRIGIGKDLVLVHRIVYEYTRGEIPKGLTIDHLCDNTLCISPYHLDVKTLRDNLLRGNSVSAINARKTHCPKGHEFTLQNTMISSGRRRCRTCNRQHRLNTYYRSIGYV